MAIKNSEIWQPEIILPAKCPTTTDASADTSSSSTTDNDESFENGFVAQEDALPPTLPVMAGRSDGALRHVCTICERPTGNRSAWHVGDSCVIPNVVLAWMLLLLRAIGGATIAFQGFHPRPLSI